MRDCALDATQEAWPDKADTMKPGDLSVVREAFGANFLTKDYFLKVLDPQKL